MRVGARPLAIWALPLAILVAALAIVAGNPGGVAERLRGIQFDSYQYARPRPYQDTRATSGFSVRVLDVDDASVARFGPWPWPHGVLAKLAYDLKSAGAAMVVFAMPLDAADVTSPQRFADSLPPGPSSDAARVALEGLSSSDDTLASAMGGIRTVTGFVLGDTPGLRTLALKAPVQFSGSRQGACARAAIFRRHAAACETGNRVSAVSAR